MNRLSALELIFVAAWLGAAILVAAVVAPAAFRVLPSRALAGAVVGQVLPTIFISGLLIAIAAVFIERRAGLGLPLRAWAPFGLMILGCAVAQFVIGSLILAIRGSIDDAAIDTLAVTDPRRVRFGKLHGASVALMGVAMIGAGWAIVRKLFTLSS